MVRTNTSTYAVDTQEDLINVEKNQSINKKNKAAKITINKIAAEVIIVSFFFGQVTLETSDLVSFIKLAIKKQKNPSRKV